GFVSVRIHNLLGQEVKFFEKSYKNAGKHFIDFDASNLSSGVYLCSVYFNEGVKTIKMTLLK
ncbi:MAG: T9SS type A sorting domain-containing protein, partial [Ignavibacteriaceae bacterium]|nr:T9SS type A sorting domain-containing protein [Ignavibacteriaceae bacterium]